MNKKNKPIVAYILIFMMIFHSLSALGGGIVLILDPTGGIMQMPLSSLVNSPFVSFLIPGLILFFVLGVFPLIASVGLMRTFNWELADKINIYKDRHWAWTWSLYTGIMLVIWITVESAIIGGGHFLQTIYDAVGIIILILTFLPSNQNYYSIK